MLTKRTMVGIIKLLGHCIGGNFNIHGHGSAISSAQGRISSNNRVNMVTKLLEPRRLACIS